MTSRVQNVRRLVGDITPKQYRHVDVALAKDVGVFMPVSGQCEYATSPAHTHPAYSFVLSFDGAMRVKVDGRVLCPRPGELSAMAPGVPHQELASDLLPRYAAVLIEPRFFLRQARDYSRAKWPALRGETWVASSELCRILRDFVVECESQLSGHHQLIEAHALRLTHEILRTLLGVTPPIPSVAARMDINRAVKYVHSHLGEPVQVSELAQLAGLSVSHFSREFLREMGVGPKQYALSARLAHARRLLLTGERNITQVAYAVGFNSSSHFASAFRAAFGITPKAFRLAKTNKQIS